MRVLVTGGLGYVGSNVVAMLLKEGYNVDIIDNLSTGDTSTFDDILSISDRRTVSLFTGDITDQEFIRLIFHNRKYECVFHLAGLKSSSESVHEPELYHHNNVTGTRVILDAMKENDVKHLVFSSSASVYGDASSKRGVNEQDALSPQTPYALSKVECELMIKDMHAQDPEWTSVILRYFNPVGCHVTGRLGDKSKSNLFPSIQEALAGDKAFIIHGNKWPTPDGTCRRDYLHIQDVARGHLQARRVMLKPGHRVYNLGSGNPSSILEVTDAFNKILDDKLKIEIGDHRIGDLAQCWANISKAKNEMNWEPKYDLADAIADAVIWG